MKICFSSALPVMAIVVGLVLAIPARAAIKAIRVATGFSRPVYVVSPRGDYQRLFVVEQQVGRILIVKNGSLLATPFLTISSGLVASGNEQGLLGLAFHP